MNAEHYDNTKALLDKWAEWAATGEPLAEGAPRQCLGAPDARIHSFDDMQIEVDKRVVRTVHVAVYELPGMERNVVHMHYGMMGYSVWKEDFTILFDSAIEMLHVKLRTKLSC